MHSSFKTFGIYFHCWKAQWLQAKFMNLVVTGLLLHLWWERENTILLTVQTLCNFLSDLSYSPLPLNIHSYTPFHCTSMIVHLLCVTRYMLIFVYWFILNCHSESGGPFIDKIYVLQNYAEGWKEGTWEEKIDERPCIDQHMYSTDKDKYYRYTNLYIVILT